MQEASDPHHEHRGKQFFGVHPFSNLLTEFDLAIAAGVLRGGRRTFLKWVGGARPVARTVLR